MAQQGKRLKRGYMDEGYDEERKGERVANFKSKISGVIHLTSLNDIFPCMG